MDTTQSPLQSGLLTDRFPQIHADQIAELSKPFMTKEVFDALKSIARLKATDPELPCFLLPKILGTGWQ